MNFLDVENDFEGMKLVKNVTSKCSVGNLSFELPLKSYGTDSDWVAYKPTSLSLGLILGESLSLRFLAPFSVLEPKSWLEDFVNYCHRHWVQLARSTPTLSIDALLKMDPSAAVHARSFVLRNGDLKCYRLYALIEHGPQCYLVLYEAHDLLLFSKNLLGLYAILNNIRPRFDLKPDFSGKSSTKPMDDFETCLSLLTEYRAQLKFQHDVPLSAPDLVYHGPFGYSISADDRVYPDSMSSETLFILIPSFSLQRSLETFYACFTPFPVAFGSDDPKGSSLLASLVSSLQSDIVVLANSKIQSHPLLFESRPSTTALIKASILQIDSRIEYRLYILVIYPAHDQSMAQLVLMVSDNLESYSRYRDGLYSLLSKAMWML